MLLYSIKTLFLNGEAKLKVAIKKDEYKIDF